MSLSGQFVINTSFFKIKIYGQFMIIHVYNKTKMVMNIHVKYIHLWQVHKI